MVLVGEGRMQLLDRALFPFELYFKMEAISLCSCIAVRQIELR